MNNLRINLSHSRWILVFVWAIFASTQLMAWGDLGHEVTAQIAWTQLKPSVKKKVTRLLDMTAKYYPENRNFVSASKWADLIKNDMPAFDNWHFEGGLVTAIKGAMHTLSESQNEFDKALMLPMLIHLVADAHQPFHCVERDKGGVLFAIVVDGKATNLHLYWDLGLGLLGDVSGSYRPTTTVSKRSKSLAVAWMKEYPKSSLPGVKDLQVDTWVRESQALADFAEPSKEYVKNNQNIVKRQIVLAGYRLAGLLNSLLSQAPAK